jgi:hypothetical protein
MQIMQFIYNVNNKNNFIENSKNDCVFEMLISEREREVKTKALNLLN